MFTTEQIDNILNLNLKYSDLRYQDRSLVKVDNGDGVVCLSMV